MSKFTHAICVPCWKRLRGEVPDHEPHAILNANKETCCYCLKPTYSGIYVRENPANIELLCGGKHNESE